jgi:hypothetical protein
MYGILPSIFSFCLLLQHCCQNNFNKRASTHAQRIRLSSVFFSRVILFSFFLNKKKQSKHRALPHRPESDALAPPDQKSGTGAHRRRSLSLERSAPAPTDSISDAFEAVGIRRPCSFRPEIRHRRPSTTLSLSNGLLRRPPTGSPTPLKPSSLSLETSRPDLQRRRREEAALRRQQLPWWSPGCSSTPWGRSTAGTGSHRPKICFLSLSLGVPRNQ